VRISGPTLTRWATVGLALALALIAPWAAMGSEQALSTGQTLYVPVYSHIYSGDREQPVYLAVTVSVRNTDMQRSIAVTTVDYYNSEGKRIKRYLDKPVDLPPLATARFVVKESDKAGGSGANFIVRWQSKTPTSPPLAESIMISTASQLGISFTSRGVPVSEPTP